jgi:N-acetylglucosaminyl-diphospho-decaprenol L-rhamnosyltransferase
MGPRPVRVKGCLRPPRLLPGLDDIALNDIAIIIVSHNSALWLRSCLRSVFAHMGAVRVDVIVVDSQSRDETEDVVMGGFPNVRLVRCSNHGFAHANNRALMICDARYVLFLNPDTEILQGNLSDLVGAMDARPSVGLVGIRQVSREGRLDMTIRRFPNALRALGDAFSAERLRGRPRWLGERELDLAAYDREGECDWTSGSFMLARREAIESAGFLDERFFMYSEETDLCRRIKTAGWEVRHFPSMTILHDGAPPRVEQSIESLKAYNRIVYARKHFSPAHRILYSGAVFLRYVLRSVYAGGGDLGRRRRQASRAALSTLLGRSPVPYGRPPSRFSVRPGRRPLARATVGDPKHARQVDG